MTGGGLGEEYADIPRLAAALFCRRAYRPRLGYMEGGQVASWHEFCGLAGRFGGVQVGADAWRFTVQGRGDGRTQTVFAFHEVMKPDFEFVQLKSAFAMIEAVDSAAVLKAFGQLNVGAIGYNPMFDESGKEISGFLCLSTSIPLAVLSLSDPIPFFLYLNLLAQAADNLEQQLPHSDGTDRF